MRKKLYYIVKNDKWRKSKTQWFSPESKHLKGLGQLRRNFHYRDRFTFLRLYKQYVRPHLEFSAPAWSPWLQGDKDTLEKVQEKAVKMVAGLKGTGYLEKCVELGLLLPLQKEASASLSNRVSLFWHFLHFSRLCAFKNRGISSNPKTSRFRRFNPLYCLIEYSLSIHTAIVMCF